MEKRTNTSNTSSNPPQKMWFAAGVSSVAVAAIAVSMTTHAVQADAILTRPTAPALAPVASTTPATLAPQIPDEQSTATVKVKRKHALHGVASWYGHAFHGRKTASGERFNMYGLTACHPTLPFGSIVRVFNRDNHKSVVVRITDRGYLDEGRIIDLSLAAAERLNMVKHGLAHVDIQVLSMGHPKIVAE